MHKMSHKSSLQSIKVICYQYLGTQPFNKTRDPIHLHWEDSTSKIDKCQLAFFLPDYNPNRNIQFLMKMYAGDE